MFVQVVRSDVRLMLRMVIDVVLAAQEVMFALCLIRFFLYLLRLPLKFDYCHLHRVFSMVAEQVSQEMTTSESSVEVKEISSRRSRSAVDFGVLMSRGNV
jgi:hypothetical protein